jgi:hypothetical protein
VPLLTIIHYEPLAGGSPIDRTVGVFDTGAFCTGNDAQAVGGVCWESVFTEDDIVWISFHWLEGWQALLLRSSAGIVYSTISLYEATGRGGSSTSGGG